jgi:hypothetical protein
MGLINRRKQPINARLFGTWEWWGDDNQWRISFNNRLSERTGMTNDSLTMAINEIDQYTDVPANPTKGKRIKISTMLMPNSAYQFYASIYGEDGRHYFFRKVDFLLSSSQRVKYETRDPDEINRIPFETFGYFPKTSTHRRDSVVLESDPLGRSDNPFRPW